MKIPVTVGFDKQHVIGRLELIDDVPISLDTTIVFGFRAMQTEEDGKPTKLRLQEASLVYEKAVPSTQNPLDGNFVTLVRSLLVYVDNAHRGKEAMAISDAVVPILQQIGRVWYSPVHHHMALSIDQPDGSVLSITNIEE